MSNPENLRIRHLSGHLERSSFGRLALVFGVAVFTTLVMYRVMPQQFEAGAASVEHTLSDGTVIRLRPGGLVSVVREFSLWGGVGARPKLVRWLRGGGQVALSDESLPFHIVTPDAELNMSEGIVDIDYSPGQGTRIRAINGRPMVTARDAGELRGVMATVGERITAEPGEVLEVRNGALGVQEDVAREDTVVRPWMPNGG